MPNDYPHVRPQLQKIEPDYHGAIDFTELESYGILPENVVDFSVNSNPFGPVQAVREIALSLTDLARYPDKDCLALRRALAKQQQIPMEQILVGNGTAELLWMICFAFLNPSDSVLLVQPTFGEYGRMARLMGANIVEHRTDPHDDFAIDPVQIEAHLRQKPRIFFLCNPNNPTGVIISQEQIERWAAEFSSTLFVLDEAYIQFVEGMESAHRLQLPNILCLRSMTKDYSLAGIRLGYVVGDQRIITPLQQVRIPWSVNNIAQQAGIIALAHQQEYEQMWARLRGEAAEFRASLQQLGYTPHPSHTHYFLMDVGNGKAVRTALLRQGLLVRLCESYHLPRHIRIATQTETQNQQLIETLRHLS